MITCLGLSSANSLRNGLSLLYRINDGALTPAAYVLNSGAVMVDTIEVGLAWGFSEYFKKLW